MNRLPPLTEEQFEALKAHIAEHGVVYPVVVDSASGELLDGHHRVRACEELGLPFPPSIPREYASEREREEEALMLNVLRRPIGPILWAQAFARLAELRGIRLGGGGDRRSADAAAAGRADELAAEFGLSARTARRRLRLAAELEEHPDLSAAVDTLELSQKDARTEVRRRALARAREQAERVGAKARLPQAVDVRVGDFAERLGELEPESVDLIYTDPPYLAALDLEQIYGELGRQAARLLKPGGSLLAYSGCYVVPRTIAALAESLEYWWILAIEHAAGLYPELPQKKVRAGWKPVLWFVKGGHGGNRVVDDLVGGSAPDKTLHDWAQSVEEARYYIERLAPPGGIVLDPFCGSGTTLLAALQAGRQAIGIELDSAVAARARARLGQEEVEAHVG